MHKAVNRFQQQLFTVLLYTSGFFGILTDLAGGMSKTPFYIALDGILLLLGVMSLSYLRGRLLWIVLFILACIVINLSYSEAGLYISLNGTREILGPLAAVIFLNKVFAAGNEEMAEACGEILRKFGVIFLVAQLPATAMQFIQYGPSDAVGGTFGYGGSGVLTFSVICMVYYLSHFTRNISQDILLYAMFIPLFLNETKISFILIPMTILFIRFRPRIGNMVAAAAGALIFFFIFNRFYSHGTFEFEDNAAGIFSADFLSDYLLADIYEYEDVPRFTKIMLGWNLLAEQTNTLFFGFEYGMFKGGSDESAVSPFARTYNWLLLGTRPYLFFLMMQGGLLLVTGFLLLVAHVNQYFRRMNNLKVYLLALLILILLYNDLFRNHTFMMIYFFLACYASVHRDEAKSLIR